MGLTLGSSALRSASVWCELDVMTSKKKSYVCIVNIM